MIRVNKYICELLLKYGLQAKRYVVLSTTSANYNTSLSKCYNNLNNKMK